MSLGDELRRAIDGKWRHVREQSRAELAGMDLAYDHSLTLAEARERVLGQMKELVPTGIPAAGFRVENGGTGDPGKAVTGIRSVCSAPGTDGMSTVTARAMSVGTSPAGTAAGGFDDSV